MFPLLDRFAAESPRAADPEARKEAASEQAIDGGRMHPEVLGQFSDSKYLLGRRHGFIFLSPPGKSLCAGMCLSVNSMLFVAGRDVKQNLRELFSLSLVRFTPAPAFELS